MNLSHPKFFPSRFQDFCHEKYQHYSHHGHLTYVIIKSIFLTYQQRFDQMKRDFIPSLKYDIISKIHFFFLFFFVLDLFFETITYCFFKSFYLSPHELFASTFPIDQSDIFFRHLFCCFFFYRSFLFTLPEELFILFIFFFDWF